METIENLNNEETLETLNEVVSLQEDIPSGSGIGTGVKVTLALTALAGVAYGVKKFIDYRKNKKEIEEEIKVDETDDKEVEVFEGEVEGDPK